MESISLEAARNEHAALLAESRIIFLSELLGEQPVPARETLEAHLTEYFARAIANGSYTGIIGWHNGEAVATGGMVYREQPGSFKNPTGRVAYILNMYTRPAYRRRGIGTAIMNRLMEAGREKGYYSFELHATPDGEPVYSKMGFYKHGEPTYRKHTTP